MNEILTALDQLIDQISAVVLATPNEELSAKRQPDNWSKKEIIGHLVDSGINNLQRFTEIQFGEKPFKLRPYHQDELVMANNYQAAEITEVMELLIAVNRRIVAVLEKQTEETLAYRVEVSESRQCDFRYLIEDYLDHFEHHTRQITE